MINDLEQVLRTLVEHLHAESIPWALVGGLAVAARAEPRFTRDIDIAVAVVDDAGAEAVVRRFRVRGYEVLATAEHELTGRLATARLCPPGGDDGSPVVDLLFASSGIEPEIADSATMIDLTPGLLLPVAATGHLVAMKLLSQDDHRPFDRADLQALLASADDAELDRARAAVALMTERRTSRGRDLRSDLEQLIATR